MTEKVSRVPKGESDALKGVKSQENAFKEGQVLH